MAQTIYFDMDGTIANLYGVDNWLPRLRAEDATPYTDAAPLTDMENLQLLLSILQNRGYRIGIISWLAKNSSNYYKKAVTKAKKDWLRMTLPEIKFDETHFIAYGTRKDYVAKDKNGILFDDDDRVREKWRGESFNPKTENIIEILTIIKELSE